MLLHFFEPPRSGFSSHNKLSKLRVPLGPKTFSLVAARAHPPPGEKTAPPSDVRSLMVEAIDSFLRIGSLYSPL